MAQALKTSNLTRDITPDVHPAREVFVPYSELLHPMHRRLVAEWEGQEPTVAPRPSPQARLAFLFYAALAAWGVIGLLGWSIAALV